MKTNYLYYVVDPISESIVGSFSAINDDMAKRIITKSFEVNKNLESIEDVYKVYRFPSPVTSSETYDEVVKNCSCVFSSDQLVLGETYA